MLVQTFEMFITFLFGSWRLYDRSFIQYISMQKLCYVSLALDVFAFMYYNYCLVSFLGINKSKKKRKLETVSVQRSKYKQN